mgnify:CR=1 FL=1
MVNILLHLGALLGKVPGELGGLTGELLARPSSGERLPVDVRLLLPDLAIGLLESARKIRSNLQRRV